MNPQEKAMILTVLILIFIGLNFINILNIGIAFVLGTQANKLKKVYLEWWEYRKITRTKDEEHTFNPPA